MSSNSVSDDSPLFSFNPNLHLHTPDPPVQIGSVWAQAYPLKDSPLRGSTEHPLLNLAQGVPGQPPTDAFLDQIRFQSKSENSPAASGHSHGYGPVFGDARLRKALAGDINKFYRSSDSSLEGGPNQVAPENIAITAGCNLAFAATVMSLAKAGEAIVVPTPWYFNHYMTLESLGIVTVPLPTKGPDFLPSPGSIRSVLDDNVKAVKDGSSVARIKGVILVTPNNPTGAEYPPALIHEVAAICAERRVALMLDETYRDFVLSGDSVHQAIESSPSSSTSSSSSSQPQFGRAHELFQDRVSGLAGWSWSRSLIQLFSFSKSYAIPGHRLGAVVAHPSFLQKVETLPDGSCRTLFGPLSKALDNLQVAPPRTDTQRAVAWAIEDASEQEWRLNTAKELKARRQAFSQGLKTKVVVRLDDDGKLLESSHVQGEGDGQAKSPEEWGWKMESAGGYYAYLKHPFQGLESEKVAEALAGLVGVVTLPGTFFMPPPHASTEMSEQDRDSGSRLRVSIANVSTERLRVLPERLAILSQIWESKGPGWGI
ncbi:PLP-dependent transferase [Violaceomyces palustris]|uniref:PLP-dependent transferase n=1 Tax=Violaceomyces palustris TaxID=1673888 RepID=A0ACD0NP65_9BASI|nr:PLP-dependent transferase [Violaceomyces palustris]